MSSRKHSKSVSSSSSRKKPKKNKPEIGSDPEHPIILSDENNDISSTSNNSGSSNASNRQFDEQSQIFPLISHILSRVEVDEDPFDEEIEFLLDYEEDDPYSCDFSLTDEDESLYIIHQPISRRNHENFRSFQHITLQLNLPFQDNYLSIFHSLVEGLSQQPRGLSISDIDRLPEYKIIKGEKVTKCSICLEDIKVGNSVRRLPCIIHVFHKKCIDTWLKTNGKCPVCRHDVIF